MIFFNLEGDYIVKDTDKIFPAIDFVQAVNISFLYTLQNYLNLILVKKIMMGVKISKNKLRFKSLILKGKSFDYLRPRVKI